MRIERIELENWMSYPRRWTPPDQLDSTLQVVPTIDLSGQALVLISGDNGAGKSAILEAICYALFAKYPRANNQDAIRSGETTAKIRLRFTLPTAKGATYCVERILSRKAGGTNALLTQLQPDGSTVTLQNGQEPVTEYIVQTLLAGVDYNAFVSTVFLRQEEAGKFMGLTHADQRAQLLRLCRLEIYRRIFDKARKHRQDLERQVKDLQQQFEKVDYATEAHLAGRRQAAKHLQASRDQLRVDEEAARRLLGNIKRTTVLADEIATAQQKLAQWLEILQDAEGIRHASQWIVAWERVHSFLVQGSGLVEHVSRREADIEQVQRDLSAAIDKATSRKRERDELAAEHQRLLDDLNELQDALLDLTGSRARAKEELTAAKEAKRLDDEIARIHAEQGVREADLATYDEVKRRRDYSDLLKQAEVALHYTLRTLEEAEDEQRTAQVKLTEAGEASREVVQLRKWTQEEEGQLKEVERRAEALRLRQGELQRLRDASEDIISNRNSAISAGVCPTCGTAIEGDIGEHVCAEIEDHRGMLASYEKDLEAIADELAANRAATTKLKERLDRREKERATLEAQAAQAEAAGKKARDKSARHSQQAAAQWEQHLAQWLAFPSPDWLRIPSAHAQEAITLELESLAGVESKYHMLTELAATYRSQAEVLARDQQGRARLSVESPVTKAQIAELDSAYRALDMQVGEEEKKRSQLRKAAEQVASRLQEAQRQWTAAESEVAVLDRRQASLTASQDQDHEHLVSTRQALQEEQERIGSAFPDLAASLPSVIDTPATLGDLEALALTYGQRASQLTELENAQAKSASVRTAIDLNQRELDRLRAGIGSMTEPIATQRWQQLQVDLSSADHDLTDLNREIGNIESDHQRRQLLEQQLADAKKQHWAFKTIEDAVNPGTKLQPAGPLFAHVTQRLMESISLEASRILEDLGWLIRIDYDDRRGFSIADRALAAVRKYDEFSGGERFAIAVAVALAIGQVTHGAGNIRCLFIDEGFGALDQSHRKRIIDDAIGKLIEHRTRDQVVVISHLRDMQPYFPNRIELRRDRDRSAPGLPTEESL